MTEIKVKLVKNIDDSYDIVIGKGIINELVSKIQNSVKSGQCLIITDTNVAKYHLETVKSILISAGYKILVYVFEAGERSKSRVVKEQIEDFMLENNVDRSSFILALGGGVTGDLAGFVAATYCRGIPFVQVPTTLLSQVDSSVGGKVAVDTPHAKNMIGAFYQPKLVFIDTETLQTMPNDLRLNGIGEIVKHGIIRDLSLFEFIEANVERIKNYDADIMTDIVARNCNIKRSVVETDEKESGLRKILNFGHTLGHAIEALSDYKIMHDECVLIGMYYETLCAVKKDFLDQKDAERIISVLSKRNKSG